MAFLIANVAFGADYIDLRRIEPIHGDASAGAAKAAVCAACHGPNGNSLVPLFPRLAGQRADYLYYRLLEFKQADPKDPYYAASPMTAQAAALSEDDMRNVAAFFAAQTQTTVAASAAPVALQDARGESLYLHGDSERGIPACQGCHGGAAQGPSFDSSVRAQQHFAAWPALRGQHGAYLISRLTRYRDAKPHATSNDFIMRGVAGTLDDDAIAALAAWLGSLPPSGAQ
jgi:cytochrome c553